MSSWNRFWKEYGPKSSTDTFAMTLTFVSLPLGFLHGVLYVVPNLFPLDERLLSTEEIADNHWSRAIHWSAMFYLMGMVTYDLYRVMTTDTACQTLTLPVVPQSGWAHCPYCRQSVPPRTHHCISCQKCILRRDHHCFFIGKCIGYNNHKYFMLFLLHTFIATLYATILSFRVIFYINGGFSWTLIGAAIFPVLLWMLQLVQISPYVMLTSTMAIFFVFITGIMLVFHSWHLYHGQTYWESEKGLKRDKGLIKNVKDLIGSKWWIVWLFPFVPSPLPGDGTHYPLYNETKVRPSPPSATNRHGGNRRMAKPL